MSDPLPSLTYLRANEVLRLVTLLETLVTPTVQRHLRGALSACPGDYEFLLRELIPKLNACLPEPLGISGLANKQTPEG